MVQYRVDGCGQVVQHAGHVRGYGVQLVQQRRVGPERAGPEYGDQPLCVERGPADEERHHDGHWKKIVGQDRRSRFVRYVPSSRARVAY